MKTAHYYSNIFFHINKNIIYFFSKRISKLILYIALSIFHDFIKYIFSKYFFKQILNAIILTLFFILILYFYLNITTNHNKYINVPELDGVAFNEAIEILDENNLSFIVLDSALYNPEYPKFSVLDQMPKSNTQVKKNRKYI